MTDKKDEETHNVPAKVKVDESVLAKIRADINPLITQSHSDVLDVLGQMNKTSLVTPNDVKGFKDAQQFVLDSHLEVPSHRTLIQKQAGILTNGRFKTADAKFWQCKKEAEVQFRELLRDHNKYKRATVDIKEILFSIEITKKKLQNMEPDSEERMMLSFDQERLLLKLEEYNMNLKILEKDIKYRMKEIQDWFLLSNSYLGSLKYDAHDHTHHEVSAFASLIDAHLQEAKKDGNQSAIKVFQDQLDTLKELLTDKAKQSLKED